MYNNTTKKNMDSYYTMFQHRNKKPLILRKKKNIKSNNWQEADQLAI